MSDQDHRHVLPGNLLTGPRVLEQGGGAHYHNIVGGDGRTSSEPDDPGHRHSANGQGTSHPIPLVSKTSFSDDVQSGHDEE